jgi:hypothetical protein
MQKWRKTIVVVSGVLLVLGVALTPVQAVDDHYQTAMGNIINSYLIIRQKLAQDSLEGVAAEADKITRQGHAVEKLHSEHPKHSQEAHKKYGLIEEATKHAAHLSHGDIKAVRKHFAMLSQPVIKYVAEFGQPHNVSGELFNYHCSMYPGSWLQEHKNVGNPLYGKKMLKCGKLVEWPNKQQEMSQDMSKMKHDMGHEHSH